MIAAELLVMRKRPATWILLAIWSFLGVFFAYVIPYPLDPEDAVGGVAALLPHSLPGTLLEGFPFFGGVFALMLGVFAFGSDYGWGTVQTLFTQGAGRGGAGRVRVFAAKLAALGVALVPFVIVLFAAGAVASVVIAQLEDAPAHWPSAW